MNNAAYLSSERAIVDYDGIDFVHYWDGRGKKLLHDTEARLIMKMLPKKREWFIDVGCGFGRLTPSYISPCQKSFMVDYSLEQLTIAGRHCGSQNTCLIAADAHNLPFRNAVFDSGVCIRLLHHIDNPSHLLSEISRVLADDSRFILNYMNRRNLLRVLRYGFDSFRHTHEKISDIIFATHPAYIRTLIAELGFEIGRIEGTGLIHQLLHASPAFNRQVNRSRLLSALASGLERMADPVLGGFHLALMQYVELRKNNVLAPHCSAREEWDLIDAMRCPVCHAVNLEQGANGLQCTRCRTLFSKKNGIYDFRC